MKVFLSVFALLACGWMLCTAQDLNPDTSPSPIIGSTSQALVPGSVKAVITSLRITRDTTICNRPVSHALTISIDEVLAVGSGLIAPPVQGDTIAVQVYETIETGKSYEVLLKEGLCSDATSSMYQLLTIDE